MTLTLLLVVFIVVVALALELISRAVKALFRLGICAFCDMDHLDVIKNLDDLETLGAMTERKIIEKAQLINYQVRTLFKKLRDAGMLEQNKEFDEAIEEVINATSTATKLEEIEILNFRLEARVPKQEPLEVRTLLAEVKKLRKEQRALVHIIESLFEFAFRGYLKNRETP